MRAEFRNIPVAGTAATEGAAVDVRIYMNKWVQICGTFTGSIDISVSLNEGGDFEKVHTGITAPGLYKVEATCTHLLIYTDTMTGAPPQAKLAGLNTRSD